MDKLSLVSTPDVPAAVVPVPATGGFPHLVRPTQGWLRAVREARGLPRRVIAEALGVSDAAVRDYELAEVRDAISLGTFRRMAKVLGCDLVVALVPVGDPRFPSPVAAPAAPPETRHGDEGRVHEPPAEFRPRDGGELEEYLK